MANGWALSLISCPRKRRCRKKRGETPTPLANRSRASISRELLPKMEVVVPDDELDHELPQAAPGSANAPAVYPAAGRSFRRTEDADRLKAQLHCFGF